MRKIINWKLFFVLLLTGLSVSFLVLPYSLTLSQTSIDVFTPKIIILSINQNIVLLSLAIFFGLLLSKPVGFGLPILQGLFEGKNQTENLKSILKPSVGLGILGGISIILLSIPFGSLSIDFLQAEMSVAAWKALLASFYGGIAEEIYFRLFLLTLFVWISYKIRRTKDGRPANAGIWLSIIVSSVIFGLGHLGITGAMTSITQTIILRAVLLNGVVSVIFGWLYWKKGLESAMIAHFSTDIVLHVITPIIASFIRGGV